MQPGSPPTNPSRASRPRPRGPRRSPSLALLGFLLGCAGFFVGLSGCSDAAPFHQLRLTDLDGHSAPLPVPVGTRAVVIAFLGVECPISNRHLPELVELERELGPQGVRFLHVYPFAEEPPEMIRRHRREFGLPPEAWRDPGFALASRLGAHRTPEVFVLLPDGTVVYQGRVNNQFTALGVGTPAPTRHDLAEVLRELLAAKGPPTPRRDAPAVGCSFRAP